MSFARSIEEARSILTSLQKEKQDGMSAGHGSPIRDGTEQEFADGMGPSAPIAELVPRRTKIHTRTSSLTRKYAYTGSGDGGETGTKSYCSGELGQKNLRGH